MLFYARERKIRFLSIMAIVFIDSPISYCMGYDPADKAAGGNGYIPISLQYRPYTATTAREHSLVCDSTETPADRSYRGKTAHAQNECHLDLVEETRRLMGDKPVIVAGRAEPSGLLPFELPASMEAVERHSEDCPHDIEPYVYADGNANRFGYGQTWSGSIRDARTARYVRD